MGTDMTKHRPPAWAACLLLLTACGQPKSAANNSVTLNLPPAGAPLSPESDYTSLKAPSCKPVEGDSTQRCDGVAGYALETNGRSLAVIAPDGRRSEIDLSKLAAKATSYRLGEKAEWRSPAPGHPTALIVRVNRDLAVARIEYPACPVAVVAPQPGQNEKARTIADGKLPGCLSP